ncbi:MAG: hypothetical protein KDB14_32870 [Planctomycetales bacterium]|nr:hypothetical protein [Planctomycetales bacterium]
MKTYHVSLFRQAVFYVMWATFAGPCLVGGTLAKHEGVLVVGIFISILFAPVFVLVSWLVRLNLSEEGVDLKQLGYSLSTPWSNVVEFDATRGREGFVLREAMECKGAYKLANVVGRSVGVNNPIYRGGRPDLVAQRRFIPIEPFGFWIRHGTLRDVIQQFLDSKESTEHSSDEQPTH